MGYVSQGTRIPGCYPKCPLRLFPRDGSIGTIWECDFCGAHWELVRQATDRYTASWVQVKAGSDERIREIKHREQRRNLVIAISLGLLILAAFGISDGLN